MTRRLYSVSGNTQRLDGGAMFGNAPRALWEAWAFPDERHCIELASRALLVEDGSRRVLLEAGIGAFFSPDLRERYGVEGTENELIENLGRLGLSDRDIDYVILSHLHFDHAGGLLTAWQEGKPPFLHFPRARFLVSRAAWERATHPHPRDRASFVPELNELLAASGRLDLVDGPTWPILGPGWRFHLSDGHTPGMLLTEVAGERGPILFAADLAPGRAWIHASITMGYDRHPELLIDEKRAIFEDLADRHGRVFFTHDPSCALAHLTRDEKGRFGTTNIKRHIRGLVA